MAPSPSKVHTYKEEELDEDKLDEIADLAYDILGMDPFPWQLQAAAAILQGKDVMIDVGTGCGKSACFVLPLLLHKTDIGLVVSPLSALMIDQVKSAKVQSVAVCKETLREVGREALYREIAAGKFRQVFVSPEIMVSSEFRAQVLAKPRFYENLRMAFVDEAHCISLWGGSFRKDYEALGSFRGRLPRNVPMCTCTATAPEHIADAIRASLQISDDAVVVAMTNARPNVALSVRGMRHSIKSKADLRFMIPQGAKKATDIDIQLLYCNSRTEVEDIVDQMRGWLVDAIPDAEEHQRDIIAFYHAKIGEARKRELEEKLRKGDVRILVCTDAVGMGCDMRNIFRVVLWGLPPSFCALVQRAGRAARIMTLLGEAILIVPAKVLKDGADLLADVADLIEDAAQHAEAQNSETLDVDAATQNPEAAALQLSDGNQVVLVAEGGVRVESSGEIADDDEEEGLALPETKSSARHKKRTKLDCNSEEARYLKEFACTKQCRRKVWDQFFHNHKKLQLTPKNTTYRPIPGARCCDNCEPDRFPVEEVVVEKEISLKRGRKKKVDAEMEVCVRNALIVWRDGELLKRLYPGSTILVIGRALLGDDVVAQLATCGEVIRSEEQLKRRTRWQLAWNADGSLSEIGHRLLAILAAAYAEYDKQQAEEAELWEALPDFSTPIPVAQFYGSSSSSSVRARGGSRPAHTSSTQSAGRGRGRPRGRGRGRGRGSGRGQTSD